LKRWKAIRSYFTLDRSSSRWLDEADAARFQETVGELVQKTVVEVRVSRLSDRASEKRG